jgi:superfamily II DNA/RNA helicase
MNVLQGSQNRRQRAWAWAEPPHVAIGTPDELLDMVRRGGFKRYNSVRTLVVDEVDACLLNNVGRVSTSSNPSSSGSTLLQSSTLHELLSKQLSPTYGDAANAAAPADSSRRPVSRDRVTIFCSATIPQPRHFVRQCVQNRWMPGEPRYVRSVPEEVATAGAADAFASSSRLPPALVPSGLEHGYFVCRGSDRTFGTLRRLLQKLNRSSSSSSGPNKALVFCDPRRPMAEMARILSEDLMGGTGGDAGDEGAGGDSRAGAAVVSVLNLDDSLSQRADALSSFRGDGGAHRPRGTPEISSSAVQSVARISGNSTTTTMAPATEAPMASATEAPSSSSSRAGGKVMRVLLSTDLAARGLDIVDITHVIHYDVPVNADTVRCGV